MPFFCYTILLLAPFFADSMLHIYLLRSYFLSCIFNDTDEIEDFRRFYLFCSRICVTLSACLSKPAKMTKSYFLKKIILTVCIIHFFFVPLHPNW